MNSDYLIACICTQAEYQNKTYILYFDSEDEFKEYLTRNDRILWAHLMKQDGAIVSSYYNNAEAD
jgi:hypothetical protein